MRVAYSTNVTHKDLLDFFYRIFLVCNSNVLEFYGDGEYCVMRFKRNFNEKEIFTGIIKDSTIYVDRLGSGMGEMLVMGNIVFSCTHPMKVPDSRIEEYFRRNSYL